MHGRRAVVQLIQCLDKLARDDIGKVSEGLAHLHDRPAQVAHGIEQPQRGLPVGFGQHPLPLVGLEEPAANPVKEIRRGDLGLERRQHVQASPAADRHRAHRRRGKWLASVLRWFIQLRQGPHQFAYRWGHGFAPPFH